MESEPEVALAITSEPVGGNKLPGVLMVMELIGKVQTTQYPQWGIDQTPVYFQLL